MNTPYDAYLDKLQEDNNLDYGWGAKDQYFTPAKMASTAAGGLLALGGGALVAGRIRDAYNSAVSGSPKFASMMEKLQAHDMYKMSTNPIRSVGAYLGFPFHREAWGIEKKLYGESMGFAMRNKTPRQVAGRVADLAKPGTIRGVMTLPVFAIGSTLMTVGEEFTNNSHPSSLVIGATREAAGLTGGFIGQGIGAAIGTIGGPIGTLAGGLIGGMLGGMQGYQVPEMIGWMKSKGRQWTMPEVGGRFKDSQMGQTMRQRSLNAISTSQFNVRSALGNEASRLVFG